MPSLLETVTALLKQGDNQERLGALLDTDPDRASALVDLATPIVVAGLANRAAEPGGADIVIMLLDGVDASIVASPLIFVERGDATIGQGLLHSIFADEHAAVTTELADWADAPVPVINRLLPGILALTIGVLGRRRAVGGVDDAGILALLDAERSSLTAFRPPDGAGAMSVDEFDSGTDRRRVAAMAGAAATVDAMAQSSMATDTTGAAMRLTGSQIGFEHGPADDHTGGSTGADAAAADNLDEAHVEAGGSEGTATDGQPHSGSEDRDAPGLVWLAAGGLAAIVVLAWALSQVVGGGSTERDAITTTPGTQVDDAAESTDAESASTGNDGEDGDATATAIGDGDGAEGTVDQTGGTVTGGTGAGGESPEPMTINEQLSLDPITFEVRSATITPEGLAVLNQAAAYLKADPQVTVEIAGHTDSDGDPADNVRLSQERADVVKAYLESQGIDGSRMTSIGYGENDPVASNDTEAGKAKNRRIEFVIT